MGLFYSSTNSSNTLHLQKGIKKNTFLLHGGIFFYTFGVSNKKKFNSKNKLNATLQSKRDSQNAKSRRLDT